MLILTGIRFISRFGLNCQIRRFSQPINNNMAVNEFIEFLNASPTPYHAVRTSADYLKSNGFTELKLSEPWDLKAGSKYFTVKAHTTIVAFGLGGKYSPENGYVVIGAHTDSPCLTVRPVSKLARENFKQVALTPYGGGIWRTWFDRGLGLAGLVTVNRNDKIEHVLMDSDYQPILVIPNLAIHLETERQNPKVDLEENLQPILCLNNEQESKGDHHDELLSFIANQIQCKPENIIDFDLRTYAAEKSQLAGLKNELILSGRLDNLFGVFTAIRGLVESTKTDDFASDAFARIAVCFDHEEVGSESAAGAKSGVFEQILKRLVLNGEVVDPEAFPRAISRSFIISADQAHGAHPNFPDRHERNHRPRFDGSVVVKINVNQRYATTTTSFTVLSELAKLADVKLTKFVVKNTSPCGSTIGPFISSNLGALTIDVGCAQLAMHSARECGDALSVDNAIKLYSEVFNSYYKIVDKMDL